MSTKVIMPSDRVRMSPSTYREYSLSYRELANLMRKTSEDTAKIVPIPSNMWDGEAPQRFTAMMTQVTGAASTVADAAMIISTYYANLAESASNANMQLKALEARFRACESQIKDAQKHSGGFSISGAIDWVDDKMSKSPDELRSSQRQIAAVMSDVHEEWQRLDAAMSSDIRNRFIPVLQAALDMLPFKFRTENMPATSTPPKPSVIPGSIRAAEAAEAIRNEKSTASGAASASGSIRAIEERERIKQEAEARRRSQEAQDKAETASPSGSVYIPGVGTLPTTPTVRSTAGLPEITKSTVGKPGSWPVVRGDSWWKISETTLRQDYGMSPSPTEINRYLSELREANPEAANRSLLQGSTTIVTPAPSFHAAAVAANLTTPRAPASAPAPAAATTGPTTPSPDSARLTAEAALPESFQVPVPAPAPTTPGPTTPSPDSARLTAEAQYSSTANAPKE